MPAKLIFGGLLVRGSVAINSSQQSKQKDFKLIT